jgi:hypothetical protein
MNNNYNDLPASLIDISTDNYGLVVHNINDAGMGIRIKAGDPTYPKSLAILSIADKNNDNKLVVKASGEVVVFNEFDANSIVTNHIALKSTSSDELPFPALPGQIMYCSDIQTLCFYDGLDWHKIVGTEKMPRRETHEA